MIPNLIKPDYSALAQFEFLNKLIIDTSCIQILYFKNNLLKVLLQKTYCFM